MVAEIGQVILIVEAFVFSWSSDFLEEGQLQFREGRKPPMSEVSSLPEGFNNRLVGYFWEPVPGLGQVKAACQGYFCRTPPP